MDVDLPAGYRARAYRGPKDHPTMAAILSAYHRRYSDGEQPTAAQFDSTYANLDHCDPYHDAVLIETDDACIITDFKTSSFARQSTRAHRA